MKTIGWTTLAASVVLGGCASAPVPAGRLAESEAAIRSAQEIGAQRVPPAAVHLKVAQDQLDHAKKLMADGENARAEYILLRAQADAEVAISLAREATLREDAQRTLQEVQRVKTAQRPGSEGM
jgi:hypothetical protein